MKKYPREHWQALGDLVGTARHQAGYSDTKRWAEAVGRSSRVLLGLERGEPVGPKTIEAIAETLGIANWSLFEALDRGRANDWGASTDAEVAEARKRYQDETGLEADDDGGSPLSFVSDEELLKELARRLADRPLSRTERRMLEARAIWEGASDEHAAALADDGRLAPAARDVGRRGTVRRLREEQDRAGEPPADDTDDMEPR